MFALGPRNPCRAKAAPRHFSVQELCSIVAPFLDQLKDGNVIRQGIWCPAKGDPGDPEAVQGIATFFPQDGFVWK